MSCLGNPASTVAYVQDWYNAKGRRPEAFAAHMERDIVEQSTNFRACFSMGRAPSWTTREDYRFCIAYLEAAAVLKRPPELYAVKAHQCNA